MKTIDRDEAFEAHLWYIENQSLVVQLPDRSRVDVEFAAIQRLERDVASSERGRSMLTGVAFGAAAGVGAFLALASGFEGEANIPAVVSAGAVLGGLIGAFVGGLAAGPSGAEWEEVPIPSDR